MTPQDDTTAMQALACCALFWFVVIAVIVKVAMP